MAARRAAAVVRRGRVGGASSSQGGGQVRVALLNPPWSFEGSVYFGCREPHFPLELGYARALLDAAGHEVRLIDAHARGLDLGALRNEIRAFRPDMTVI